MPQGSRRKRRGRPVRDVAVQKRRANTWSSGTSDDASSEDFLHPFDKGLDMLKKNNLDAALECFLESIEQYPDHKRSYIEAANLLHTGFDDTPADPSRALDLFTRVAELGSLEGIRMVCTPGAWGGVREIPVEKRLSMTTQLVSRRHGVEKLLSDLTKMQNCDDLFTFAATLWEGSQEGTAIRKKAKSILEQVASVHPRSAHFLYCEDGRKLDHLFSALRATVEREGPDVFGEIHFCAGNHFACEDNPASRQRAAQYYERAMGAGYIDAFFALEHMHRRGHCGVAADTKRADQILDQLITRFEAPLPRFCTICFSSSSQSEPWARCVRCGYLVHAHHPKRMCNACQAGCPVPDGTAPPKILSTLPANQASDTAALAFGPTATVDAKGTPMVKAETQAKVEHRVKLETPSAPGTALQRRPCKNPAVLSCHQCNRDVQPFQLLAFCTHSMMKRGAKTRCQKRYCNGCLRDYRLVPPFPEGSPWVCPSCQGVCTCRTCVRTRQQDSMASVSMAASSRRAPTAGISPFAPAPAHFLQMQPMMQLQTAFGAPGPMLAQQHIMPVGQRPGMGSLQWPPVLSPSLNLPAMPRAPAVAHMPSSVQPSAGEDVDFCWDPNLCAYVCLYCNKTATARNNMVIHIRVHTGEKPFKCGVCQRAFTQASSLRRHQQTVHKAAKSR